MQASAAMGARRRNRATDLAKALSHPLRQRLLTAYNEGAASPSELSVRLDEPLGNVAYHTKRLLEQGCVELVDVAKGRGGVKHTYRATVRFELSDEAWARLPGRLQGAVVARTIADIARDVADGTAAGGFQDPDVHVSRVILDLDARGRRELADTLRETVARADRIAEESQERGAGDHRSILAIMHFRTPGA